MAITRRDFARASLGIGATLVLGKRPVFARPADIIKKAIPSSGEKVPIVGVGTNRYGVGTSNESRAPLRAALRRFHQLGGTVIDTAPQYRSSESVLGDLIADLGIRDDLFIATKADRSDQDAVDAQMNQSLQKLRTERFDAMQVHNLRGWQESLAAMREWKQDGRIRYIGITTSRSNQYEVFEKVMRKEQLDLIQINYSLEQRESAKRLLPLAADRGIGVIINRVFGGGRIFQALGNHALPVWAKDFDCSSWAQFLLKYALSHPAATVAIPGMTKAHHVDDNMMAAHGRLPDASERKRQEIFFDAI